MGYQELNKIIKIFNTEFRNIDKKRDDSRSDRISYICAKITSIMITVIKTIAPVKINILLSLNSSRICVKKC